MISHRYKCIFVEVPKTGCTSVMAVIGSPPKAHLDIWQIRNEMASNWSHYGGLQYRVVRRIYRFLPVEIRIRIGESQFNAYFKFGFVRNPWDRTVSLYERREGLQMADKMTFEEFVGWIEYSSDTCIHPLPHKNQLDWFINPDGNVMVDFIGKFENFKENWSFVCNNLGIKVQLPHKNYNVRKQRHYTEYYNDTTKDTIAKKFKVDIDYFGYEFGN